MPQKTLVFDLDGTLIDTAPDLAAATSAVLNANGRRAVSLDEVRDMVGFGGRKLIERGFERTGDPLDPSEMEPMFRQFIDFYSSNIAVDSRPYPGIVELLERAGEAGMKLAVCTNKMEVLAVQVIDELNLSHHFGAIIGPDTIGIAKPDPAPLYEAIQRVSGDRNGAYMIGDSATDIRTAQAAKVPVIAVSFGYTDKHVSHFDPDHVVDHIDEIWPIVSP